MGKISEELQMIDSLLMEFHERIQSGRCLTNKLQNNMMLKFLHEIANKDEPISKAEACSYVRVSRLPLTGWSRKEDFRKDRSAKDGPN